ncbi:hypothetical protein BJ138DRAFT_1108212, partial [Hygrophoropsis aurantiaca]
MANPSGAKNHSRVRRKKTPVRRGWTTEAQEEFLESHKSKKEVQDNDTENRCLTRVKIRIQQWFNNHTHDNATEKQGKHMKILNLCTRKKQKLPPWQAYSQLYYDDRVRPVVEAEWPERRAEIIEYKDADDKDPPEVAPLWFRNKISMHFFDEESDDIIAEVEEHHQSLEQEDGDDDHDEEDSDDDHDEEDSDDDEEVKAERE